MPECWFRRVLWLATTEHFRLFRYSKCWVGTQNPLCNAVFLCKAPNTNFIIPAQTQLSSSPHVIIISAQCSPPNTTFSPNVPLPSSAAHFNNLLYITLPPSLLNALPWLQPIFTRRTRGHSLGKFRVVNCLFTRLIINAVPFTSPCFFLFLFFFKQPTLSFPSATYIGPSSRSSCEND